MKTKLIVRIVIYGIVLVILTGLLLAGISFTRFRADFSGPGAMHDLEITETSGHGVTASGSASVSPVGVNSLEINWVSGNILIRTAQIDEITVTETASAKDFPPMHIKVGRTLKIDYQESTKLGTSFKGLQKDLEILVPEGWECRALKLDAAATNVEIREMVIGDVDLNTAGGSSLLDRCTLKNLDVDSASGDLVFSGMLNTLDIDSASGAAKLELWNTPQKISMDSISGELELTLPSDAGFTIEQDSLVGSLTCDFPVQNDTHRVYCGDGACRIEMDSLSTSLIIHKGSYSSSDTRPID